MDNLFSAGDPVQHIKGGLYKILRTPEPDSRLEYCNEPYYEYLAIIDGTKWIRCKSEMEDGRFKPATEQGSK